MRTLIAIILSLVLISCFGSRPISSEKASNNKTYEIYYLFEHDGCKVYRFNDGRDVYFTNCKGNVTSIEKDSVEYRIENQISVPTKYNK